MSSIYEQVADKLGDPKMAMVLQKYFGPYMADAVTLAEFEHRKKRLSPDEEMIAGTAARRILDAHSRGEI